ncbi:CPBP family intramembrane glutamic endopeptidase [Eupransor demetentiae]|uniref:CAAX protease family (YdiL) n=1 Tax=Eupransor demetentiae TaxID=3109584 RepID=A0ABM9N5T2_9LACO|nr:CAAX protease family (YdiL) [Lactobacillaceae bacterium LMG 33000]
MKQSELKFYQVALITVGLSILWTGLSRFFNLFSVASYNTMFRSATTIFWHVLAPMALAYLAFFIVMTKLGRVEQVYQKQPDIQHRSTKVIFGLIVTAMLLFAAWNLYHHLLPILENWSGQAGMRLGMAFLSTFFVGLTEESVFRGFALSEFRKRYSEQVSCLLSLLLFGLWHFPNVIAGAPFLQAFLQVFSTMIIGAGLYMTVRLSKSIWGGVAMHCFWDFALVIAH